MKKLFLIIAFFTSLSSSFAQTDVSVYLTDLKTAQTKAVQENKTILMVFAGSDWCVPCMQFKKEILETEIFQAFAKDELALLYLDFPARKKNKLPEAETKKNEALADKYNPGGAFPKIILIDAETNILGEINFHNQKPETFINACKKLLI